MDAQLKFLIRLIGDRKYHQRAVDTYTTEPFRGIDWQLQQMQDLGNGLRGTEAEWKHVISRVESIYAYLDQREGQSHSRKAGRQCTRLASGEAQRSRVKPRQCRIFSKDAAGDRSRLRRHAAIRPDGHSAAETGGRTSSAAWEDFAKFLESTYGNDSTDRFAAGTEEYEWRVRNVFGDTRSAAQLYEYGGQQIALYSGLIKEIVAVIAKEAGLGAATTRDVVAHLAKDSPRNDDQLFAWYARPRRARWLTAVSIGCSTYPQITNSTSCQHRRSSKTASTLRTTWRPRSRRQASAAST